MPFTHQGIARAGIASLLLACLFGTQEARADSNLSGPAPTLTIPCLGRAPLLEDFLDMRPSRKVDGQMAKVEGFLQRMPRDGEPSSQRTEVYVGYDDENLYAVFVAFDSERSKIRARLSRRDDLFADDTVGISLDTYHDKRRAYSFSCNPLGIQQDARWIEGTSGSPYNRSFDTLWHTQAQLTPKGYVVWMAIPFKSLRFSSAAKQTWGIYFSRWIPRVNELAYWPHVSTRIEGRVNQAATLKGLENISPGRNMQVIPFGFFRSFRSLDEVDSDRPQFITKNAQLDGGMDAKFILKGGFVVDVALNPDFSQVESDHPQVTTNQRFEVFFPEKRPFFLENASFFQTPINLFFTRRIADPQFGVRLTGKSGPFSIGALLSDDQSPGREVSLGDPIFGRRAKFVVLRLNRDIFQESTLGMIYTDREFLGSSNRVGGVDTHIKLNQNWAVNMQAVTSSTQYLDGTHTGGPAYDVEVEHTSRQLLYRFEFNDRSPGFNTLTGFLPGGRSRRPFRWRAPRVSLRPDIRSLRQFTRYRFRPEGKYLISWGPSVSVNPSWDHQGTRLDFLYGSSMNWEFIGRTFVGFYYDGSRERLRPVDIEELTVNRDFAGNRKGFLFTTDFLPQLSLNGKYSLGTRINFVPPEGEEPELGNVTSANLGVTLRPTTPLRIDNTYIVERLTDRITKGRTSIFNNHILRSRWNWQFNRKLSLRVIFEYNTVLANPLVTELETSKNFNADFLVSYQVNPWTALFVGYNGNAQNIDLVATPLGSSIIRTNNFIHDARQFFVKFSYFIPF